jgi:hypothetical protein
LEILLYVCVNIKINNMRYLQTNKDLQIKANECMKKYRLYLAKNETKIANDWLIAYKGCIGLMN